MLNEKLLLSASLDEFAQVIAHVIEQLLQRHASEQKPQTEDVYLSRSATAKQLTISLVTLHTWTQQGKLHAHKVDGSSKVYYSRKEVLDLIASSRKSTHHEP
jgi:Fe2+ or Zn2+ uptake regulation protein